MRFAVTLWAPKRMSHANASSSTTNAPRTHLPFLRKVVQDARRYPNTSGTSSPFRPYPLLREGETKQRGSGVLYKDSHCIVVNDVYPKAKLHCLVMPLDTRFDSLNAVRAEHVSLLRHFIHTAESYLAFLRAMPTGKEIYTCMNVSMGFHSLPSLPQLHMHLISMDLDSPCLKTKKHYNSFATPFFLPAGDVVRDVEQNGCVTLNRDVSQLLRMEERPLQCLWCGRGETGMPQLKAHLRICGKSRALLTENTK